MSLRYPIRTEITFEGTLPLLLLRLEAVLTPTLAMNLNSLGNKHENVMLCYRLHFSKGDS